ncbi:DAK2 domain-containing protein [Actinomyces faecalis]|uniref:DAK2 domain-containing protein n=1 Tax=Actinomyces faecalis TaxID=2722820 RepID=UPI0015564F8C|nr:DAK2 domain-containing protein [Actinomyces faecalis]
MKDDGARPIARSVDAAALRSWLALALTTAERTRPLVNSLNVFPVPDSDTGTNVALTLRSAVDALRMLRPGADAAQVSRAAADGAVRGARGNSGLLVSQALAALADEVSGAPDPAGLRPVELVHAYERIASTTWAAVSRPVTGTLLTVARDAATTARQAFEEATPARPATVSDVAAAAALGAQESVVETAGLGHGPVDAGGAALMLLLTALSDVLGAQADGTDPAHAAGTAGAEATYTHVAHQMLIDLASSGTPHSHGYDAQTSAEASTGEFEVMYLLEATASQAAALRRQLEAVGDSVGVVGTPDALGVGLYQVHVHTDTPRAALPRGGRARQVCIHHLVPTTMALAGGWDAAEPPLPFANRAQAEAGNVISLERLAARRRRREAAALEAGGQDAGNPSPSPERVGVIACTRAPGLIEQLARTGAVVVLAPEREGIVRAVGDLGLSQVLVLPCDAASGSAAHEAARHLAARTVPSVVSGPAGARLATDSSQDRGRALRSPQLLVADTDDEARVLAAAVAVAGLAAPGAAGSTQPGGASLTDLARGATLAGVHMRTLALDGPQAEAETAASAVADLLRGDDELVTVILGRDALPDVGSLVATAVAQRAETLTGSAEAVEVVVHAGGQVAPDVLIAVE